MRLKSNKLNYTKNVFLRIYIWKKNIYLKHQKQVENIHKIRKILCPKPTEKLSSNFKFLFKSIYNMWCDGLLNCPGCFRYDSRIKSRFVNFKKMQKRCLKLRKKVKEAFEIIFSSIYKHFSGFLCNKLFSHYFP